jgi:DNA-binding transcriptional regulator LsrR (DeoR family)
MDYLLQMRTKELSRLEVMHWLTRKRINQKETGRLLRLSTRQIKRLLRACRERGTMINVSCDSPCTRDIIDFDHGILFVNSEIKN